MSIKTFQFLEFVLALPASVLQGWVLSVLWSWFVSPTFGLPFLTIPIAIGICLIVAMFNYHVETDEKTLEDRLTGIFANYMCPFIVLVFGWFVHLFV